MWRAQHLSLGSEVAIKLIDPTVAGNTDIRTRFMREAQAAAQLRSPHVVQVLDYGVEEEVPFIAMELMAGESLAERLDRVGRLSPEATVQIVTEVSRALRLAHERGIVHRDLKPDNIFLVQNDDTEIAKVLDFGVAKTQKFGMDTAAVTSTGAVVGTPYYMSPEQAEGLKELDHRTDIWALGVIAYECMVGVRPFDSETLGGLFLAICTRPKPVPSVLIKDVPSGFDEWFEKCTARLLPDRFATAREAAVDLRRVVAGQRVPERTSTAGVAPTVVAGTALSGGASGTSEMSGGSGSSTGGVNARAAGAGAGSTAIGFPQRADLSQGMSPNAPSQLSSPAHSAGPQMTTTTGMEAESQVPPKRRSSVWVLVAVAILGGGAVLAGLLIFRGRPRGEGAAPTEAASEEQGDAAAARPSHPVPAKSVASDPPPSHPVSAKSASGDGAPSPVGPSSTQETEKRKEKSAPPAKDVAASARSRNSRGSAKAPAAVQKSSSSRAARGASAASPEPTPERKETPPESSSSTSSGVAAPPEESSAPSPPAPDPQPEINLGI